MHSINFFAPINQDTFNGLMNNIANSNDDIFIKFSSNGGDVNVSFRMYHYLRTLNRQVTIQNIGDVMSSAIIVFLAADIRFATSNSIFLIHALTCPLTESATLHTLIDRQRSLQFDINRYNSVFIERTAKNICSPINILETLNGGSEIILNAQDALSAGIISRISDS